MTDFRGKFEFISSYVKVFFRSLSFLWTAAPRETIFITIAILLQGIVPAVSVWITKLVIDTIATALAQGKELGYVLIGSLVAGWIGALLLSILLNPWIEAIRGNLTDKLTTQINLLLMRKADTFTDLSRFETSEFYDELQILRNQVSYQPASLLQTLVEGARSLVTVIAMIGLLSPLGLWIPFVVLIAIIPEIVVSFKYETKIWLMLFEKSPQTRRMDYYNKVMLTDTYAKEVRLFKLGSFFIRRYLEEFKSLHQSMRHLRNKQALWSSNLGIMSTLGNGIAFYWIVKEAFRGTTSPGSVLLFVQSLTYLQQNIEELVRNSLEFYENLLYMQQFFNFLDSNPPMLLCIPEKPVPDSICSEITFEKVNFYYPENRSALVDVSFTLYPGETVAIVGENGAGKSTLIKLLTRLYDPTAGRILIDGVDLRELNLDGWRQQIAGVFQDFGRYALTLGENIALGNLEALEHPELVKDAIEKAGILKLVDKFPTRENTLLGKEFDGTELSGGEWQKLALARAFVRKQAQILILDEPTAALDPRSESEIYSRFVELARGKTTILITHRLGSVLMADRILVMKGGHLVQKGTHQELLQRGGEYATLWNMQTKQYRLGGT